MKTTIASMAALAAFAATTHAKIIDIEDVPADVRAVIEANVPAAKLDDTKVNLVANGNRYVVKVNLKGGNKLRVEVSAEGDLLKVTRDVNFNSLPNKVRNALEDFLNEADEIVSIERVTKGGQVSYLIEVDTGDDGDELKILIGQNGVIIEAEEDLDINELSQKLRKAVNKLLKDNFVVEDIDRIVEDGEVTYRIEIENTKTGTNTTVTLDKNGIVIDGDLELSDA